MKFLAMAYSLICYLIGFSALVYLILFIGDIVVPGLVPWTINIASPIAPNFEFVTALGWNIILIMIWGLQHSIMANPHFKAVWTKVVPASVERSTYLVFVAAFTAALVALWVPLKSEIWNFGGSAIGTLLLIGFFVGWTITFISTFLINHFHLFGLSQAYRLISQTPSKKESFVTPLFYKVVRHPMMTGVLIALWCTPVLTSGRLVFNLVMTLYILIGTKHEERALVADLGEEYEAYRGTTPMLVPGFKAGSKR